ncbi:MAG: high-affinity branched-chain amino acid ABC transporter permease LivM [Candidatus Lambdaproteobacteria bacterium]|nr:high-affinity branched-chain amino acid ABC transporter permease LivM [Candidatus Lambdaproteobacteria bacterium]
MNLALALKDSAVAALVSVALFIPIVGMVLDGRSLDFQIVRALVIVGGVFVGRLLISLLVQSRAGRLVNWALRPFTGLGARLTATIESRLLFFLLGAAGMLILLPFLPFTTNYLIQIVSLTLIYVLLGMGLNIVVGLAGLLDLGYVAFYAMGAYSYALLAKHLNLDFWTAIPIAGMLAALSGCVLGFPVLRMHGDYLAIVTLGFGEIIRILLVNLIDFTGGPNGISAPRPTLFGLVFSRRPEADETTFHDFFHIDYSASHRYIFVYLVILVLTCLAIWIFTRLREMPIGRAWEALREDEVACKALGINHLTTKLSAFTLGATFGGVGGALFGAMEGFLNPSSFTFIESAIILSIVVLGGMGSVTGVILAAVGITLLPELFREFEQFRMLVFGLAMVFVMIWRPTGLLRLRRKSFARIAHADR